MASRIFLLLLLEKASFQNYAASVDLAVHLLRVFGKSDTSYLGPAFDNHRRAFDLKVFDYCYCISVEKLCSVAVFCHFGSLLALFSNIEFVCAVLFTTTLGAFWAVSHTFCYKCYCHKDKLYL